ncbi:MAG: restriction endonuclease, SacI family, partial [Bacteroidota bacterium]
IATSFIKNETIQNKVESICRSNGTKAPIRFMMSCLLAKTHRPELDIRKPYTEIEGEGTYSGRYYDEAYIQSFIVEHKLPCNPTTAFLTPAFRTNSRLIEPGLELNGRPKDLYALVIDLVHVVYQSEVDPQDLLREIIRVLIIIKHEDEGRMEQLLSNFRRSDDALPLSSEQIVTLLQQHLSSKHSSRLPVLMVSAAYMSVRNKIGEKNLPLESHTAADSQTGALGDLEISLINDARILTCYEMKDKKVTIDDINHALSKVAGVPSKPDNYIFITTDVVEKDVENYARSIYEQSGIEVVILDCIGFVRHFLHFFHRDRLAFLNIYQELVLSQPISAVGQPLKELFLTLRRAAETE